MDLQFYYELTKEEINLKTVSLQIVMTWHGNNVYVSGKGLSTLKVLK